MRCLLPLLFPLLALVPASASAVTVTQVVSLSKAGVSQAVILALIDRDQTVFTIEPEQIVSLQRDGLSEPIILAMLKNGRHEDEQAAPAGATALIVSTAAESSPSVAFVGHGPDRPNTLHHHGFYSSLPIADISPYPYVLPYGIPLLPSRGSRRFNNQLFCVAQTMQASGSFSPVFITACPDVMPPRRFTR